MNIVVFGANGSTGRLLAQQALADGHAVKAFTRHPETFPVTHDQLQVIHGDVFDLATVDQAVVDQDVVLSTLGGPFSRKPVSAGQLMESALVRFFESRKGLISLIGSLRLREESSTPLQGQIKKYGNSEDQRTSAASS
jgi:putative NADH-flavin reductase